MVATAMVVRWRSFFTAMTSLVLQVLHLSMQSSTVLFQEHNSEGEQLVWIEYGVSLLVTVAMLLGWNQSLFLRKLLVWYRM